MEESFYCVNCGRNYIAMGIEVDYSFQCPCGAVYRMGESYNYSPTNDVIYPNYKIINNKRERNK